MEHLPARWAPIVLIMMGAGSLACGSGDAASPTHGSATSVAPALETVPDVDSEPPVPSTTLAPTTLATVAPTTVRSTTIATVAPTTAAPATTASTTSVDDFEECLELNRPLIQALDQLHLQLDGGIAFGDYTAGVQTVSEAIDLSLLPRELWETDCRYDVSDPLAQAWKVHLTTWGEWETCLGDASCNSDDIDAATKWEQAQALLLGAIDGLAAMAPDGWEPSS